MVKVEVQTPNKRKSIAKNTPMKKVKAENGTSPAKVVSPKKPNQSPKVKVEQQKVKKEVTAQPGKGVKPFAGVKQFNNKQKNGKKPKVQVKTAKTGEKKKRNHSFGALIKEVQAKQGQKDPEVLNKIAEKVKAIETREELTKTAKKKLSVLNKLRLIVEQGSEVASQKAKELHLAKVAESKKAKQEKQQVVKKTNNVQPKKKPQQVAGAGVKKVQPKKQEVEDEDDDEDDSDAEDEDDSSEEGGMEIAEGEDDDDEDDDDDEEDEDDDSDDEEVPAPKKIADDKTPSKEVNSSTKFTRTTVEDLQKKDLLKKGQKRFLVFVGNIPYDITKQDLAEHFQKVGKIVDVRIALEKVSNRPRGFAYVEVDNEISYEKCLSMHHSHLKGRRINVLYTQGGKKKGDGKKNEIKIKNLKLHAMRKQGKLAGSTKESQKRSFRRNKAKMFKSTDASKEINN